MSTSFMPESPSSPTSAMMNTTTSDVRDVDVDNGDNDATTTTTTKKGTGPSGVAGRTNYAAWDKITSELVSMTEEEEAADKDASQAALGLDGTKYAYSQDHASEQEKLKKAQQTKKQLEKYRERETSLVETLSQLLGPVIVEEEGVVMVSDDGVTKKEDTPPPRGGTKIRITRDMISAGKRVLTICDTAGRPQSKRQDTIVVTQDLSLLESTMGGGKGGGGGSLFLNDQIKSRAKSYPDDAENNVVVLDDDAPGSSSGGTPRQIFGLIKIFLNNLHHCTVWIKCKIITGTLEIHNCHNVTIKIGPEATVATIQTDLSSDLQIEFHDAPSGKNPVAAAVGTQGKLLPVPESQRLYWGEDADDRIFHAGVSDLRVAIYRDGVCDTSIHSDYIADGAVPVGNATAAEYQFVTSVVNQVLVTEKVVRAGATTGTNARAMTEREMKEEARKREQVALQTAEHHAKSIKILDKDGNELPPVAIPMASSSKDGVTTEENEELPVVYGGMSQTDIDVIVAECEQNRSRGNQAFGAGEYAQAILLYSLALDKAAELPDHEDSSGASSSSSSSSAPLFPRDVVYSNRAACFLKLGQHEKALADATQAHQLNPHNIKAIFRQGLALHAAGQYEQALPILAQALKLEPSNKQIQQALKFAEVRFEQQMRKRTHG